MCWGERVEMVDFLKQNWNGGVEVARVARSTRVCVCIMCLSVRGVPEKE